MTAKAKTAPEVSGDLLQKVDEKAAKTSKPRKKPVSQPTPTPPPEPEKAPAPSEESINLGNQATDQAVDDIASKEGDTMLALQDAIGRKASHMAGDLAEQDRRRRRHKRMWLFFLLIVLVGLFLLAVPYTSYSCHWPVGIRLRLTTDILPSVCK